VARGFVAHGDWLEPERRFGGAASVQRERILRQPRAAGYPDLQAACRLISSHALAALRTGDTPVAPGGVSEDSTAPRSVLPRTAAIRMAGDSMNFRSTDAILYPDAGIQCSRRRYSFLERRERS
jgi:hypothetical protein